MCILFVLCKNMIDPNKDYNNNNNRQISVSKDTRSQSQFMHKVKNIAFLIKVKCKSWYIESTGWL